MAVKIESGSTTNKLLIESDGAIHNRLDSISVTDGALSGTARNQKIVATYEGEQVVGERQKLFHTNFNQYTTINLNSQFLVQSTTQTVAASSGFLQFNSGASVAVTTGVGILSMPVFPVRLGKTLILKSQLRTVNATATNKSIEIGFGNWNTGTAGQGAAVNDGACFRWDNGGFHGVLNHAGTETSIALNSNVPLSDSSLREYEIRLNPKSVEFWIQNVQYGVISKDSGTLLNDTLAGANRAASLQAFARVFNTASIPSAAPKLELANIGVYGEGGETNLPAPFLSAWEGRSGIQNQPTIHTATGGLSAITNSQVAGVGSTPTNTTTVPIAATSLGGYYQLLLNASFPVVATDFIINAWLNPAVPLTAGVANDAKTFFVTRIRICKPFITTVGVLGGHTGLWLAAVGSTAVTLATADSATAKSPRRIALGGVHSFAAAPIAGAIATGDYVDTPFETPLVVNPGEYLHIIYKSPVTTAYTSGVMSGFITVDGFWE